MKRAILPPWSGRVAAHARLTPGRTVTSVFLGGGTPSLMKPESVGRLLELVGQHWQISADAEITLEANPSSVEAERFRGYRTAGVNRLSLGVQALNDADLKFLGRLHNVDEALRAVELARETFPRLSFDLIYARPDQSLEAWEAELRRAIGFAADHLSLYQLTIEPDTAFEKLYARRQTGGPGCGRRRRPLRTDAGDCRRSRSAGLRDLQPRHTGRRKAGTTFSTGVTANISASVPAPTAASSMAMTAAALPRLPSATPKHGCSVSPRPATG